MYCMLCKEYIGLENSVCYNLECKGLSEIIQKLGIKNIYNILKNYNLK